MANQFQHFGMGDTDRTYDYSAADVENAAFCPSLVEVSSVIGLVALAYVLMIVGICGSDGAFAPAPARQCAGVRSLIDSGNATDREGGTLRAHRAHVRAGFPGRDMDPVSNDPRTLAGSSSISRSATDSDSRSATDSISPSATDPGGFTSTNPGSVTASLAPLDVDPGEPEPPSFTAECLARFRPIRMLGRGGMGVVFLMQDRRLERLVAIKVLQVDKGRTDDLAELAREARAAAALNHVNVVTVYDVVPDDLLPYMVCEFVEGETLARCRDRFADSPIDKSIDLIVQVLDGLAAAHDLGIVHRDLKPANILIRRDGLAKIADFGLARSLKLDDVRDERITGTPAYMSPEQCQGKPTDTASDLYSVGVILYELLAGRRPFAGPSNKEFLQQHVKVEPPAVEALRAEVPPSLAEIVGQLLAKDPAQRPADARTTAARLRTIRSEIARSGGLSASAVSGKAAARVRRRVAVGVWAIVLVAVGAAAIFWFQRSPSMPWPALLTPPSPGDRATATAELARAQKLVEGGQYALAEATFIQAIHADEGWSEAHRGRAELALQQHQLGLARGEFQLAAQLSKQPALSLLGYGRTLLESNRLADANVYIRMALEWDSRCAPAHAWLAEIYRRQGDKPAAIAELRRAVTADPGCADTAVVSGRLVSKDQ